MSLRLRILVTTSALVVAIVGSLLGILSWIVSRQVDATVAQVSARGLTVLNDEIENYEDRLSTETALLADRPGTRSVYQTDRPTISEHLDELTRTVGADWMVMTDGEGHVIGASRTADPALAQATAPLSWIAGPDLESSWRGMMTAGRTAAIAAAQPIVIGSYRQAILLTGVNVSESFLIKIARAADCQVAILGPKGVEASTIPLDQDLARSANLNELRINGTTYVGTRKDVPGAAVGGQLQLLSLLRRDRVTAPFAPLWQGLYALLAIGMVLAVGAGAWLAFDLTRPLDDLVHAARTIKDGGWPDHFGGQRRDEIGVLQSTFDDMARSLRSSRERLIGMLEMDPLTEMSNYRAFREKLDAHLATWEREGGNLGLMVVDIDQFEEFNQARGTAEGDRVLLAISKILAEEAGPVACGRTSGNVFAAILAQPRELVVVPERVRERVAAETGVTVSIGVSRADDSIRRSDLLLLAAELAASQAKAGGRNRIREFRGFEFSGNEQDLRLFLQQGSYPAVRALAEAVDAKDEYTRGHSTRVAQYARELAIAAGCDSGFVDLVYMTGTLHDVGKIGVPDAALKKPGRLTVEEFDLIKLHPVIGEKIVAQIPQLTDTLPGIRSHHERWDGAGYPDGLAADAIPLVARILAVVDTFDAMTSHRPYRDGLAVEVALAEIERGAGSQFDPQLASHFVEMRRAAGAA